MPKQTGVGMICSTNYVAVCLANSLIRGDAMMEVSIEGSMNLASSTLSWRQSARQIV